MYAIRSYYDLNSDGSNKSSIFSYLDFLRPVQRTKTIELSAAKIQSIYSSKVVPAEYGCDYSTWEKEVVKLLYKYMLSKDGEFPRTNTDTFSSFFTDYNKWKNYGIYGDGGNFDAILNGGIQKNFKKNFFDNNFIRVYFVTTSSSEQYFKDWTNKCKGNFSFSVPYNYVKTNAGQNYKFWLIVQNTEVMGSKTVITSYSIHYTKLYDSVLILVLTLVILLIQFPKWGNNLKIFLECLILFLLLFLLLYGH